MNEENKSQKIISEVKKTEKWSRALYMVVFLIAISIAEILLVSIMAFQFVLVLFTSKKNSNLLPLCKSLSSYIKDLYLYLTYCSDKKPYPFGEWPKS